MSTLVLGREIVAEALRSGDARAYIEAGLTWDFMHDDMHPAYTSVFTGQDIDAWKEILRYLAREHRVPDPKVFRLSFPEGSYELPGSGVTAHELAGLAVRAVNQYEAEVGSGEAGRYIDAEDPDGAARIMLETARKILNRDGRGSVKITIDDAAFGLDAYLDKEIQRGPGFGMIELDRHFGGFQPSQLITILGRAKANKTTFLAQSAFHAWYGQEVKSLGQPTEYVDPRRVMFISTEIDAEGIQGRFLAYGAQMNHRKLTERTGEFRLNESDKDKIRKFWNTEIGPQNTKSLQVIQPTGRYTVDDMELDIESFGADIVYLDGFYFLHDVISGKPGAHWEAHDNLARELKSLAMRHSIPVVLTHQVREKQLGKAGGGIEDGSMMGGTGLRMASDLVITADKNLDTQVITLKNTASRSGYLPTIQGEWDWNRFRFDAHEYTEEEEEKPDEW